MTGKFLLGILVGAGWGWANAWCLAKAARCLIAKQKGFRLVGWLVLKFVGLYGLLAFFLIFLQISAIGWLIGFGLSLIGLAFRSYRSFAGVLRNA